MVDRLTHHGHILNMNGDSYRLTSRLQEEQDKTCNQVSGEE
ncbi:MAG TPA: ATP-binding protein [Bacillota bacterium]